MKILLIEDNKEISKNIKDYLELDWFSIDCYFDGEAWLDNALKINYDLIILDLMLPKIDWITISRKLQNKINTPIIIISAKEDIDTKLKWFSYGVIDYIVKPFDLRELDARIKVILNKNNNLLNFWNYIFDFDNRIFKFSWKQINVWKTEYQILKILFENKNKFVSRGEIIEEIWWENALFDSDWKLDVYISNIRSKFWKDIFKTSKWYWYKFNLNF